MAWQSAPSLLLQWVKSMIVRMGRPLVQDGSVVRMGRLLVQDGSVVRRGEGGVSAGRFSGEEREGGASSGWAPWLRALELTLQAKLSESFKYSVRTWLTVPCQLYDRHISITNTY